MTVPRSQRTHGNLEVYTKARDLKIYTLRICTNENNFPKRYRWCLTNDIVKETTELCRLIVGANAIRVETELDKIRRLQKQKMAYELTEILLEDVDTAFNFFKIPSRRIEYWSNKIEEIQVLLTRWMKSDAERY